MDKENEPRSGLRGDPEREPGEEHGPVERQLAQYAFTREEREREVRLLFRDAPAAHIAHSFWAAGATLITLSGERSGPPANSAPTTNSESRSRRRRKTRDTPPGEITLRYFYALGGLVYTVSIVSPSGVVQSIAGLYPSATLSERELSDRLSVVFVG